MHTDVHSDLSWESGCTSKGKATLIKARKGLMWMRNLCWFYVSTDQNQMWNTQVMLTMKWSVTRNPVQMKVVYLLLYKLCKSGNLPYSAFISIFKWWYTHYSDNTSQPTLQWSSPFRSLVYKKQFQSWWSSYFTFHLPVFHLLKKSTYTQFQLLWHLYHLMLCIASLVFFSCC